MLDPPHPQIWRAGPSPPKSFLLSHPTPVNCSITYNALLRTCEQDLEHESSSQCCAVLSGSLDALLRLIGASAYLVISLVCQPLFLREVIIAPECLPHETAS